MLKGPPLTCARRRNNKSPFEKISKGLCYKESAATYSPT
jgi:hypothetical protein